MPRLRLTLGDGSKVFVDEVAEVEVEKICPYGDHSYFTASLVRVYCCDSHSVMFRKKIPPELRTDRSKSPLTHHSV